MSKLLIACLLLATASQVLTIRPIREFPEIELESHLRYQEPLVKTQIIWNEVEPPKGWADFKEEFQIIKYLASGGFSDIYLANDLKTGQKNIVLKKMAKSFYFKPERWNDAEKELAIVQRLPKHENICQFYRFAQDKDYLYYTLENCGSSNVWNYALDQYEQTQSWLSEDEARRIFRQALAGLEALHNHSIYHLDFTERNMFYDLQTKMVKIGDFGLSISTDDLVYPKFGTPAYYTPERQMGTKLRPSGADIWYLGVGLFRVTTGLNPFGQGESENAIRCMKQGIFDIPSYISPELRDLFRQIFQLDEKRITLQEVKVHNWFTQNP